ncbi:globin [Oceanicoccus sp. KOV_DT_Chl]|uniref:globin n=1 Tax=Oceanicoccus sp. KOV_DT_Chl TaxID=1904639 RepID=UPI000C797849|nr:globin [Oceanicoccus sp. KOV_DT_Chl]
MKPLTEEIVAEFNDSLERCGNASKFLGRFYQIFSESSPDIAAKFASSDMHHQIRALKTSFYMAMVAADVQAEAAAYLERIAQYHNRDTLDIKPEYYQLWIDSMVQAVSECDPQFDQRVDFVWREFMRPAIEFMQSRY